jgi:hypothetical protein
MVARNSCFFYLSVNTMNLSRMTGVILGGKVKIQTSSHNNWYENGESVTSPKQYRMNFRRFCCHDSHVLAPATRIRIWTGVSWVLHAGIA